MDIERPCKDCGDLTFNDERCRDCDIEHLRASGSCRECFVWLIDPDNPVGVRVPPVPMQHKQGCSLRDDPRPYPRTPAEVAAVRT